jgi:hypothetical protein
MVQFRAPNNVISRLRRSPFLKCDCARRRGSITRTVSRSELACVTNTREGDLATRGRSLKDTCSYSGGGSKTSSRGRRHRLMVLRLSPEDAGRVAVDLGEEVFDSG